MANKKKKGFGTADSVVEKELDSHLQSVEDEAAANCLAFVGPIYFGTDDAIRDAIERRVFVGPKKRKLVVLIETFGGYIEVAQRIVQALRHHYTHIEFVVPNHAMSAGTVLVLSGNEIWMDYYSILGPVDPQVENKDGQWVPALGYLEQYKRLVDKSAIHMLTTAELAYLMQRFDPAEMYKYEQARNLSITLLVEWLAKYKFRSWKKTDKRKIKVTPTMKRNAAKRIGELLNKTDLWHSHGRGISMEILRKDVGLQINDLKKAPEFYESVKEYYGLLKHYMGVTGKQSATHVVGHYTT